VLQQNAYISLPKPFPQNITKHIFKLFASKKSSIKFNLFSLKQKIDKIFIQIVTTTVNMMVLIFMMLVFGF
jgi:hypothetical protein